MVQHEENSIQAAAFALYYALGEDRSFPKLGQHWSEVVPEAKKSPALSTFKNWSSWFHWQQRVIIKDKAVAAGIDKLTTKAIVNRKAEYLELVDALIESCFERTEDGTLKLKLEIEKPRDFKDAVELALKLMGEPEARTEHNLFFEWVRKNAE